MSTNIDLNAVLGDWRGAGYTEETARRVAARVNELVEIGLAEIDEPTQSDRDALWTEALSIASREIPPDEPLLVKLGTDARGWVLYARESDENFFASGVVYYADEDGLHALPEAIVETARIEARADAVSFVDEFGAVYDHDTSDWADVAWSASEIRARLLAEGWNDGPGSEIDVLAVDYVLTIERETSRLVSARAARDALFAR